MWPASSGGGGSSVSLCSSSGQLLEVVDLLPASSQLAPPKRSSVAATEAWRVGGELEPHAARPSGQGPRRPRRSPRTRKTRGSGSSATARRRRRRQTTPVRAPIRSMWSGVLRIAASCVDVGAVGERALARVRPEQLPPLAREAPAKPGEERLDARRRRSRSSAARQLAEVLARTLDELEREPVRLLVRLAPRHEPVVREHDRARVRELGDALRELEAGPQVRHDRDVVAERLPHRRLGIGRVRERADRVGVDVVDVRRRQERVQERLDRRPRRVRARRGSARGRRPSPRRSSPSRSRSGQQVVEPEPREVARGRRREVGAAALDPHRRAARGRGGRVSTSFVDVLPPPWRTSVRSEPISRERATSRSSSVAPSIDSPNRFDRSARQEPRGACTSTVSPGFRPSSAEPSGEVGDTVPEPPTALISTVIASPPSSTISTTEPMPTSSPLASSTISALSSRWRSVRMRASRRPCSFLAAWYSKFSERSPNSRAVLIAATTAVRRGPSSSASSSRSASACFGVSALVYHFDPRPRREV